MEKESKIIEPSICLPKDKELLETTEAVTVKFGAGQISLGFHWNDDVLLLEILNKEPNTIIGLNLNGYLVSRSIGRKIFMQDASVHLEPRNTANLKVGNYDFLSKHCFSKKELKDSSIKRVKAGFIFEILLRFAEKQEDEDTIE